MKNGSDVDTMLTIGVKRDKCYEPLERFIGIMEPRQNNGDNIAIIPLDIRNGVILTSRRAEHPTKSPT